MPLLWSLFVTFWKYLPWVAIALMAALAFRKRMESKSLMLQAVGAAGIFFLRMAQWVIVSLLLTKLGASFSVLNAANIIFEFLLFMSLLAFAAGYCMERISRGRPAVVTATAA